MLKHDVSLAYRNNFVSEFQKVNT